MDEAASVVTTESHEAQELQRLSKLVVKLAVEIDVKNMKLIHMMEKCDQLSATVKRMETEKQRLQQDHDRVTESMQCIMLTTERTKHELECQRKHLELRAKDLDKREMQIHSDRERIDALMRDLEDNGDDMQCMEILNQTLINKERTSNSELQDARKALIRALSGLQSDAQSNIGIKRMGEIDTKPFRDACSKKSRSGDWEMEASELCSSWQQILGDPNWHPFKNTVVDGKLQEVIDDDDDKLAKLRSGWGEPIYKAVVNALLELNDYNPSGRFVIRELWNFEEGRKASLKEGIEYLIQRLTAKPSKRKR